MDVHIEMNEGRIWLASPYRQDVAEALKEFPGVSYSDRGRTLAWVREVAGFGPKGAWTLPLNYRVCMDLRTLFRRDNLIIHKKLWAWAAEEKRARKDLTEIMKSQEWPTPVIRREYPRLYEAIHDRRYQSVGIAFAMRRRFSINGDHPGLGKTLQAAGAAVESRARGAHLVVAPTSAQAITWPDEFEMWLPGERYTVVDGSKEVRRETIRLFWERVEKERRHRHWLFINPEMLQQDRETDTIELSDGTVRRISERVDMQRFPGLYLRPWSGVFVDEAHRYLPTKSAKAKDRSMIRNGFQDLPVRPSGLKMAMSGTILKGNPLNLWGTLNWLLPEQFGGYWTFVDRWFDVTRDALDEAGEIEGVNAATEREFGREIDSIMIRRTKPEVAPDLPAKQYGGTLLNSRDPLSPIGVWLDMTPKQRKAHDGIVEEAIARLDSGELMASGVLAELTRCKQFATCYGDVATKRMRIPTRKLKHIDLTTVDPDELWVDVNQFCPQLPSNKFDWLVEFLAERGIERKEWGDGKVVVASQYTQIINLFAAELTYMGVGSHVLTGETKIADRRRMKHSFQDDGGPRVFFLNTDAGGVSLTLDAADDLVFLDEKWIPDDQEQVEDRIHRISRIHQVGIWYLRSRGTIDERIAVRNDGSDRIQKRLLDGRRGVAFAKQLITEGLEAA